MTEEHLKNIEMAVSGDCPKIYANGFASALGIGDVFISFQTNGKPAAALNLSFTIAKTLSVKLGQLIADLERDTGQTIMTTDEVIKALNEASIKTGGGSE